MMGLLSHRPGHVICTLFALSSLTAASVRDCLTLFSFTLNREYIADQLCEKRGQQGNTCRGCCLLKRELEKNEHESGTPAASNEKQIDTFQTVPAAAPRLSLYRPEGMVIGTPASIADLPPLPRMIDHPPKAPLS